MKKLWAAFATASLLTTVGEQAKATVCEGIAGNLVANCGFETDDLTGWTLTPASSGSRQFVGATTPNSGGYAWNMGAIDLIDDVISQLLPTAPGRTYQIQFYYNSAGDIPNGFTALWDASPLVDVTNTGSTMGYIHYSFRVTGTGSDTISFGGYNTPGFDQLDDVSVVELAVETPEPASLALCWVGLVGLVLVRWRMPYGQFVVTGALACSSGTATAVEQAPRPLVNHSC